MCRKELAILPYGRRRFVAPFVAPFLEEAITRASFL